MNEAAPLLYEYNSKKVLAKLGYRFDSNELSVFDAEVYNLIASEISQLESEEIKKNRAKKR